VRDAAQQAPRQQYMRCCMAEQALAAGQLHDARSAADGASVGRGWPVAQAGVLRMRPVLRQLGELGWQQFASGPRASVVRACGSLLQQTRLALARSAAAACRVEEAR
jgi:hypothetical protein